MGYCNHMEPLSSNHFSHDLQVLDVLNWMETEFPEEFAIIQSQFPEVANIIMEGAWFDTKAMGVDVEWSSWLTDEIEQTCFVVWWEGEPFFDPYPELSDL